MAEYLELTQSILEKRENATRLPDMTIFHLNEKQCTRLWHTIRKIYNYFSTTSSYLQSRGHTYFFTNIFQEFYIIVTRADGIINQFSDEQYWLQAAIFQGNDQQTFKELTEDLQACVSTFTESTQHLIPVEVLGTIWRQDEDMIDCNITDMDAANLRSKLKDLLAQPALDEEKRLLAEYLIEREKSSSCSNSQDEDPPQFYTVHTRYPILGEHIGHGSNASVYKVNWLGVTCAKKYFDATEDEELMKEFVKEASILAKLNHPHILKMLCTSVKPEVSFVMEIMPMSLRDFIRQRRKLNQRGTIPFTFLAKMDMMLQIARGVEYLHEQGISHRDLKSSNILVSPSADEKLRTEGYVHVKLSDMGLDKMKMHASICSNLTHTNFGTGTWLAPEIIEEYLPEQRNVHRNFKSSCDLLPTSNKDVKKIDFGSARTKVLGLINPTIDNVETTKWQAPEICSGTGSKKIEWKKVDTYCFAMTCLEILIEERPFNYYEQQCCIAHSRIIMDERPKLPLSCPKDLISLLEACWHTQPCNRPSFKDIIKTLTMIKRSFLEPDYALEYLQQTKIIMEQRESACCVSQTFLQLNEKQSTSLWQNLKTIHNSFSSSFMDFSKLIRQKCEPFFKEFYIIVTRADAIVHHFNSQQSWLEAVILQGDHGQAFKELTIDLQDCALVFYNFAKSQYNSINPEFDTILSHLNVNDDDYQLDAINIGSTLQKLITDYDLTEEEKHLAHYLVEREKNMSSPGNKDVDHELPPYYRDTCGYPTSILDYISQGATGSVYKVNWLGMTCARKHFDAPKDENLVKAFMKEVKVLAKLNHPHIVKLFCMNEKPEDVSFVMEIMPMSLFAFIKKRWTNHEGTMAFTILAAIDIMLQIARGMEYSHDQDIVHRDLKSTNILVAPSKDEKLADEGYGFVKLTDLGSAKMKACASTYPTYKMMGTTNWRAPEAFQQTDIVEKINWKKADTYSFAMTCSEILTGEIPYHYGEISNLYERIISGERPLLPSSCPKDLASLLEACWDNRPNVRPSFTEIRITLTSIKRSLLYPDLLCKPEILKLQSKGRMVDSFGFMMNKFYLNLSFIVNMLYAFLFLILLFFVFYFFWARVGNTLVFCILFYFLGLKRGRGQLP